MNVGDFLMAQSLAKNPRNNLSGIKCPQCQSTNWYRTQNMKFHCKRCVYEWQEK